MNTTRTTAAEVSDLDRALDDVRAAMARMGQYDPAWTQTVEEPFAIRNRLTPREREAILEAVVSWPELLQVVLRKIEGEWRTAAVSLAPRR